MQATSFDPALGRYDNQEMLSTNSVGDWDQAKTIIHLGTTITALFKFCLGEKRIRNSIDFSWSWRARSSRNRQA